MIKLFEAVVYGLAGFVLYRMLLGLVYDLSAAIAILALAAATLLVRASFSAPRRPKP